MTSYVSTKEFKIHALDIGTAMHTTIKKETNMGRIISSAWK